MTEKSTPMIDEGQMASDIREQVMQDQPEAQEMGDKEVLDKYLNDDKTKLNSIYWANQFEEKFRGNWFSVEQVTKKTSFKKIGEAMAVLQVMCFLGVCHFNNDTKKYKITLDLEKKILLMKKEKENLEHEKQKALFQIGLQYDMRIASIEESIKKMEGVPDDIPALPTEVAA